MKYDEIFHAKPQRRIQLEGAKLKGKPCIFASFASLPETKAKHKLVLTTNFD